VVIPLHDDNPTSTTPYVTYGIIVACTLAYVWQHLLLSDPGAREALYAFGVVPAVLTAASSCRGRRRDPALGVGAHLHVHARRVLAPRRQHAYLWIFGNNLEDAMGHVRYFLFYVLCGVGAVFAQVLPKSRLGDPMVGASGPFPACSAVTCCCFPAHACC